MTSLYQIRYLGRVPLKTAYPAVVARIGQVMRGMPRGTDLVVDFSGVGRGIYDMLVNDGLSPIGVTMTGGLDVHWNGSSLVTVPKLTLVSKLVARLHGGELLVHGDLADWPVLRRELMNFRPEVTRGGQETWNSRSGEHDDLVIATALCTWFLEGGRRFQGVLDYYRSQVAGTDGVEKHCVGVDIGQSVDPTANCVMTRIDRPRQAAVEGPTFTHEDAA
jgi:hypothetical protein